MIAENQRRDTGSFDALCGDALEQRRGTTTHAVAMTLLIPFAEMLWTCVEELATDTSPPHDSKLIV